VDIGILTTLLGCTILAKYNLNPIKRLTEARLAQAKADYLAKNPDIAEEEAVLALN